MISGTALFIGLFNNLAIFIALIAAYGYLNRILSEKARIIRQSIIGLVFGTIALVCMLVGIPVADGVTVDQRNTIVILSGMFGGPFSVLICAVATSLYRIHIGGLGLLAACLSILLASAAGILLNRLRPRLDTVWKNLAASLLAAIVILPGLLPLGDLHKGWELLHLMMLPYAAATFIGIFLGSHLLTREEYRFTVLDKLQRSEHLYRELYESLVDVAFRTDMNGVLLHVSPSVEKAMGYATAEVTGRSVFDFFCNPSMGSYILDELQTKQHIENYETDVRRKDGTLIRFSTNAKLLRDENGDAIGVEGVARDISTLKKAEEAKVALEERLRQSQKMESIGTLAGGIAHDFNNILAAIIGYAEMALQKPDPAGEHHQDVQGILRSALRARELVRHILIFSRKASSDPVPVDVSLALKEALHLVRASLPVTITLKEQMRCRSRTIMADPTEIHQVIINLCTNAAQAMENTGGVITVTLDRVVLSDEDARKESLLLAGPYIMITVSDTGAGIEKQHIERIFDPFFTTREIGSGSGLGLAVVHGIVSRHGGKISVESEPGNGAKFTVYFREAENAPKQLLTPATTPAGGNERILLVDDELLVVEVTRRRLELLGYQVSSYTRSDEALECFLRQPDAFDCIITDQTMPKMTGEQLTRAVLDVRPDIPVILCTGYSALVDAEKAEKIGVKAFVLKPFDQKNLAHTVRTVLDGSRVTATA